MTSKKPAMHLSSSIVKKRTEERRNNLPSGDEVEWAAESIIALENDEQVEF